MVETCTACGRRYFPTTPNWGTRCGACLATEFEKELAREILRATERMPPRRSDAAPADRRAAASR
ncbi:MAG TPA: hypothetical protein VGD46_16880 [Rhizobacter sp.]